MLELQQETLALFKILLGNEHIPQLLKDSSKPMTRQKVIQYLEISESTYKRKVKDGSLKPMKTAGGHRFYKQDLQEAYAESIRRGRM